jgi:hypothetical protein
MSIGPGLKMMVSFEKIQRVQKKNFSGKLRILEDPPPLAPSRPIDYKCGGRKNVGELRGDNGAFR